MKKIKDARAKGCDYAYIHEGTDKYGPAEIKIKFYDINANTNLICIKIATKAASYSFIFTDKFDANGSGEVETSALVKKEGKILLDTGKCEDSNIMTSVRVHDADIITRGKKLLNKREYEQLKLFELFDTYVPENMKGLEERLNRSYTILPTNNDRGY